MTTAKRRLGSGFLWQFAKTGCFLQASCAAKTMTENCPGGSTSTSPVVLEWERRDESIVVF